MAMIRGMIKYLTTAHMGFNESFIEQHTTGHRDYLRQVEATCWNEIEAQSGLSKDEITHAAEIFVSSKNVISTWAMGITQHRHSVATIREIANLHLLFGQIGRLGAGLCPVRGHSNVQGNRTMGINEKPPEAFIDRLENVFGLCFPKQSGHNVYSSIKGAKGATQ